MARSRTRLTPREKEVEELYRRMNLRGQTPEHNRYYAGKIKAKSANMDDPFTYAELMNFASKGVDSDDILIRAESFGIYSEVWPFKTMQHDHQYRPLPSRN